MDIDTKELKLHAPLIPYVKKYYSDIMPIEQVSTNCVFTKCLWHEEDTASLALFNNGSYKCFGCGEAGNVISFVMKTKNMQFLEALRYLADRANIHLDFGNKENNWNGNRNFRDCYFQMEIVK